MSYSSGQGIKDQLNATSSNLHDYWSNGLGMFGKIAYPLTKLADVQKFANEIIKEYP